MRFTIPTVFNTKTAPIDFSFELCDIKFFKHYSNLDCGPNKDQRDGARKMIRDWRERYLEINKRKCYV